MSRVSTLSVVEVTVRVETGTYGSECTMQQILEQASREGVNKVRAMLHDKGVVVGEPKVITVTTAKDGL